MMQSSGRGHGGGGGHAMAAFGGQAHGQSHVRMAAPRMHERPQMMRVQHQQARVQRPQRIERVRSVENRVMPDRHLRVADVRAMNDRVRPVRPFDNLPNARVRTEGVRPSWVAPWAAHGLANGFVNGCPPGLAKKDNGYMPPGQAKALVGRALPSAYSAASLTGPWRTWYRDDNNYQYRMGDGMIYRVARTNNLVDALIPYGMPDYGYYPVGQLYPADYNYYNVPYPYQSYYPDGGAYDYRFGNGAIYGVDPGTNTIQSIVALLAGDLSVGQRLPMDYSVYNVPMAYRSQYYDTPNDWYRYNDGYIYRVDPTSQLITAIVRALV